MKMVGLLFSIAFALAQLPLPFGPSQQDKPEEIEKPSPVKGWWMISYFGVPPTRYQRVGQRIIKAESVGSRSTLFREVSLKEKGLPVLSWRWKISNVVRSAIETRKDRYDAAARVIVVFGKEKSFWMFEGLTPRGLRIEYIWASRLPVGKVFNHPSEKFTKIFVLESGEGKSNQWVAEQRDLRKDYTAAFGTGTPEVVALGLETDTDHSNEMVTAYYAEPLLKKR